MNTYTFTVVITCATAEQANKVLAERIQYDEDYGFPYTIDSLFDMEKL